MALGSAVLLSACGGRMGASLVAPSASAGGQENGTSKVTIRRDTYGTPHVYASSPFDLLALRNNLWNR